MKLNRYTPDWQFRNMYHDPHGDWASASEAATVEAERDALQAKLSKMQAVVDAANSLKDCVRHFLRWPTTENNAVLLEALAKLDKE